MVPISVQQIQVTRKHKPLPGLSLLLYGVGVTLIFLFRFCSDVYFNYSSLVSISGQKSGHHWCLAF